MAASTRLAVVFHGIGDRRRDFYAGRIGELINDNFLKRHTHRSATIHSSYRHGRAVWSLPIFVGGIVGIIGTLLGAVGAVIGTLGGYQLRKGLVKALGVKDILVAIPEESDCDRVSLLYRSLDAGTGLPRSSQINGLSVEIAQIRGKVFEVD